MTMLRESVDAKTPLKHWRSQVCVGWMSGADIAAESPQSRRRRSSIVSPAGVARQGAERALRDFVMVGNEQAAMGRRDLAENDSVPRRRSTAHLGFPNTVITCRPERTDGLRQILATGRLEIGMPRHSFDGTGRRVALQRVGRAFALEITSVAPQMDKRALPLHATVTVSRSASSGNPRSASSRRSCRIRAVAAARLSRASALVRP